MKNKILMICDSHEGGIYDYAKIAYKHLKKHVSIDFIYLKKSGVWNKLKFYRILFDRLINSGKDVIVDLQCLIWPIVVPLILIKKIKGFRLIFELHDEPFSKKTKYRPLFIRKYILKSSDIIVAHSEYGKKRCKRIKGLPKIIYIPFGPLLENAEKINKERIKKILNVKDSKVGLFFGVIQSNKGLDILLKAIPLILEKISNFKLLIVGPIKENFTQYEYLIDKLKIENYIEKRLKYVPIKKAGSYFIAADLVILPYREITQSAVPFAAYMYKKPVIASDVGGLKEVVKNGITGFLVKSGKNKELARIIIQSIKNDKLLKKMGLNGYNLITKGKFSWNNITKKYLELLNKITEKDIYAE